MRTADGRRGGRVAPGFSAVYVAVPVLLTDGTNPDRVSGIGVLAVVGASLLLGWALVGGGWPRLGAAGWAFLGGLLGLVIWTGASVFWSVVGDRSWDYLNLGLIYLAFAVVGVLAGAAGPWAVRWAAGALAAALGAAMLWALAGKVVPGLDPEGDFRGRVRGTVDYWNAFALLTAWGLLAGLWLARSVETWRRVAGALLVYGSTVALLLTFSRGGLVVAGLAVAAWVLLVPERLESLVALAAGALPGLGVAAVGFALEGVSRDDQPRDIRVDDGVLFALALAAGAAVVVAAVIWAARRGVSLARTRVRPLVWVLAAAAVLSAGVVVAADATRETGSSTGPSRLLGFSSSDRWEWWGESVEIFRDRPLAGSGAGSFDIARRPIRDTPSYATEPHNVAVQFLGELGLVGAALFVLLWVAAAFVVVKGVRRLEGDERLAGTVLAVAAGAFGLHALIEFDWDFVALTGPALLFVGMLAAAGRPVGERVGWLGGVAAGAVGLAALLSLATTWAARERLEDAQTARSPARAAAAAQDAHELNPLSADALIAWAFAEEGLGDTVRARELYAEATELQPENPVTWRRLGAFELDVVKDPAAALAPLERARELDPFDPIALALLMRATGGT